jgi:SAM-dependent methyltransferase
MHACDTRSEAVQDTRAIVRDLVDEDTAQSCVQQTSLEGLDDLDATFDWVIVDRTEAYLDGSTDLEPVLQKAHALLNPGGWLYLTVPAGPGEDGEQAEETALDEVAILFAPEDLSPTQFDIELMECRSPERVEEHGETRLHALYRKVKRARPG